MALEGSLIPDITETLPVAFNGNPTGTDLPPKFVPTDSQWDVGLGDLAFILAASKDNPYIRESAEVSKQQLDTSKESGEQTLNQWWLRSQTSWHRGAGINFYEPGSEEGATQHRFAESYGVDVWTEGQLTLLHAMDGVTGQAAGNTGASATTAASATAVVGGVDCAVLIHAQSIRIERDGASPSTYTHSYANVGNALAIGSKVYFGHSTGIARFDAVSGVVTNIWTQTAGSTPTIGFAKGRFIASVGPALYELPLAGGALGSQTAIYTHQDPDWRWTGVADSPSAILLCGYSGSLGQVFRVTLGSTSDGSSPKLGSPEQIAELPPGETVHAIYCYLGAYVALGTARGVRVGTFSEYNATFSYGPLTIETQAPVRALSARDRFCYAAITDSIQGYSGAARIDLSVQTAENRYAWAWDAQCFAKGPAGSIAFVGSTGRVVVGIDGWGHYAQSPSRFEAKGSVLSGKMRYGTSEPKSFRLAKVRVSTQSATVTLFATADGSERAVLALTDATNTNDDIDIATSVSTGEYASFRLQLQPGLSGTTTPVVEALTIKALPAPKRQRLIRYPLMCFDSEKDRWNTGHGYPGAARERLAKLEHLEETQAVILVQDFTNAETFQASIEKIQFTRDTAPQRKLDNFGGILQVTVRKLL